MRPNPQETAGLLTFTEEILNEKIYFLCSARVLALPMNVLLIFDMHWLNG